jgi:serine/threonine-protein kinase 24/25/MST4
MSKKTSYLTELIERHERWKAEGGEKLEDEEQDVVSDLYGFFIPYVYPADNISKYSPPGGDPEDLWDFGTVRHNSRGGTIGRAQQNPVQLSGPPLTWENNTNSRPEPGGSSEVTSTQRGSGSSISSLKSSLTAKGELPPLPSSTSSTPSKYSDHQATVRNVPSSAVDSTTSSSNTVRREPSDEYEDYGDQYVDTYQTHSKIAQEGQEKSPIEDELPDTTMLDSVILPAIASVSAFGVHILPS